MIRLAACALAASLAVGGMGSRAGGQSSGARVRFAGGAMGVAALTHATPAVFGESRTEGYLTQPNAMMTFSRSAVSFAGTLNLEGYTLRRGELNAGIYGEGFVDRRHPHTLVHEAILAVTSPTTHGVRASLIGGKGFTPFGTDDPMMRPFVKYPVNHHHAQIIERVLVGGALAWGTANRRVSVEHAVFNGDEPVGPFVGPQWQRVGDSRASRVALVPARGIELQASRAFVRSPGIIQGGAFDHTQSSLSLRIDRGGAVSDQAMGEHSMSGHAMPGHTMTGSRRYLLAEVARTDEGFGATRAFRYQSALLEGMVSSKGWSGALRLERTDRPESERLLDPFRLPSGHIDFQIIGITRWNVATLNVAAPSLSTFGVRRARWLPQVMPYAEVSVAQPRALLSPAVFIPRDFYGKPMLWSFTTGLRLHLGTMRSRMGRYGVLAP